MAPRHRRSRSFAGLFATFGLSATACSSHTVVRVDIPEVAGQRSLILVAAGRDLPSPKLFGIDLRAREGVPDDPIFQAEGPPSETISLFALFYPDTLTQLRVAAGPIELTSDGSPLPEPDLTQRRNVGSEESPWATVDLPADVAQLEIRNTEDPRCLQIQADSPFELPAPDPGTYHGERYPVAVGAAFVLAVDESTVWVGARVQIHLMEGGESVTKDGGQVFAVRRNQAECCEEVRTLHVPLGGAPFTAATRVGHELWLGRYDGTIVRLDESLTPSSTVAVITEPDMSLRSLTTSGDVVFALTQTRTMYAIGADHKPERLGQWLAPKEHASFDRMGLAALPGRRAAAVINDSPYLGILSVDDPLRTDDSPRPNEGLGSVMFDPSLGVVVGGAGFFGFWSDGRWVDSVASVQVSVDVLMPASDGFIWAANSGYFGHYSAAKLATDGNGSCPAQQLENRLSSKLGVRLGESYAVVADSPYPYDRGLMVTFVDTRLPR